MSYARRAATNRTPAMQAALDKRAAMMLRVHEARVAGEMADASCDAVQVSNKLVQDMKALVAQTTHPEERKSAFNVAINPSEGICKKTGGLKTSNPVIAAYEAMIHNLYPVANPPNSACNRVKQSTASLIASRMLDEAVMKNSSNKCLHLHEADWSCLEKYLDQTQHHYKNLVRLDDDDNVTPRPLSTSTIPAQYFLLLKSGR